MPVSVIMPAHNAEAFIAEAIQSVLAQTHTAWELIVVDDNSSDKTAEISRSFKDPRIRVLSSDRQLGAAGARNLGTQNARNDFLNYLDADDRLTPTALATLEAALLAHPEAGLVYANYVRINEAGQRFGARRFLNRLPRPSGEVLEDFLAQNRMVNGGLALVRKKLVEEAGGWMTSLRSNEDWVLWVKIAARTRFHYLPGFIALEYRELPTGLTQTTNTTFESRLPALEAVYGDLFIRARLGEEKALPLRRASEAHSHALIATQLARKGQWQKSLSSLHAALTACPAQTLPTVIKYTIAVADRLLH